MLLNLKRLILLASLLGLCGCGQSGPLYLPPPGAPTYHSPHPLHQQTDKQLN